MALFDKVLGKDSKVRELEKEIRSLEVRKQSVFTSINGEIARLQNERTGVLLAAGTKAYEVWSSEQAQVDLTEFWNKIQELEHQMEEQESKRTEMGLRYDEEILLIQGNLQMAQMASAPASVSVAPSAGTGSGCPKCGAAINDDDIFCQGCGTKLK